MSQYNDNWLINIRQELYSLGLNYIWNLSYVDDSTYIIIKERMLDTFKQLCYSKTMSTPKGLLYQHLLYEFRLQKYLRLPMETRYIKEICKIRICAHKLNVESGRYRNIERSERICTLCNVNVIEDEYHFIIECPQYKDLRCKYIKMYYYKRPSVYRFIQLLTTGNNKELKNLGKYLLQANAIRDRSM